MEANAEISTSRTAKTALYWGEYPAPSDTNAPNDENVHAAADWLLKSVDVTGVDGSSTCFRLYAGWSYAYPETTGYIIPTLYRYAARYNKPQFAERATAMARWVTTLQTDSGALPGGAFKPGITEPPSVFNSGQMIIGLVSAYEETGDAAFLDSAARAAKWLADEQDDSGAWQRHAYRAGFSPSYYTRVCWPMLMTTVHTNDTVVRDRAIRGLRYIAAKQKENGAIADWGFSPVKPAFTHTIAYTIRGFLESGMLGDDLREFLGVGETSAMKVFRILELRKRLAGAYDPKWRGSNWYTCLTGNCQLAICWLRLFDLNGDARLCNAACKAIDVVTRRQKLKPWLFRSIAGGIPGSAPVFGRYLTLRYPNWAAKFYMDAIMMRNDRLASIRQHAPGTA